jgi:hypothetical protein
VIYGHCTVHAVDPTMQQNHARSHRQSSAWQAHSARVRTARMSAATETSPSRCLPCFIGTSPMAPALFERCRLLLGWFEVGLRSIILACTLNLVSGSHRGEQSRRAACPTYHILKRCTSVVPLQSCCRLVLLLGDHQDRPGNHTHTFKHACNENLQVDHGFFQDPPVIAHSREIVVF